MNEHQTWYVEARVGSNNYRGDVVRFIDDRRGVDGHYMNRPAEEVIRELRAQVAAQAAAITAAVLAERERCCQAVCVGCSRTADWLPAKKVDGDWIHGCADSDDIFFCRASAIREQAQEG